MTGAALQTPLQLVNQNNARRAPGAGASSVSPADLAELLGAFNEVTARLQCTHDALRSEVARLQDELHVANQQLRRARELAALGEMAAGIAHEIRNPLGSIQLYASALEEDLLHMPDSRRLATRIAGAVRGLDAVVSDVLTFARERRVSREVVSVGAILDLAMTTCADVALRTGIGLRQPGEKTRELRLWCDAAMAKQAVGNVLRNAFEAMENVQGVRRVEVAAALRSSRKAHAAEHPMISIVVRDHGPGVCDEVKQRMFNPFFTTRHTGTGLGLAIVHRIVDAHGGRLDVRNHKDGGAVVELLLPAATEAYTTAPANSARAHGGEA